MSQALQTYVLQHFKRRAGAILSYLTEKKKDSAKQLLVQL